MWKWTGVVAGGLLVWGGLLYRKEVLNVLEDRLHLRFSYVDLAVRMLGTWEVRLACLLLVALMMLGVFKQKREKEKPVAVAVGRNALCPCGSGRKYKRCCGKA